MATTISVSVKQLLFHLALLFLSALPAGSIDYDVGIWDVDYYKNPTYNSKWSRYRFYAGDTLRFEHEKDSVMVVSEGEFRECAPIHPILASNGTITFRLDKPGKFYFISGLGNHCDIGMNMMIEVMAGPAPLPAASAHVQATASLPLLVLAVGNVAGLFLGL